MPKLIPIKNLAQSVVFSGEDREMRDYFAIRDDRGKTKVYVDKKYFSFRRAIVPEYLTEIENET